MDELTELKNEVRENYRELLKSDIDIHETINGILDLIGTIREEMKSLRVDVDKLIENSQGSLKKTA